MPNYDVLEDTASYHGTRIITGAPSQQFKDGWDRIFGQKQEEDSELLQKRDTLEQKQD